MNTQTHIVPSKQERAIKSPKTQTETHPPVESLLISREAVHGLAHRQSRTRMVETQIATHAKQFAPPPIPDEG